MDRFNILVPPDEDFPEVVVAQRMAEGFEKEYVEYEPRWRFDRRRRAVVADEKFFYAMADTAERLKAENAKLRELCADMHAVISDRNSWWDCMCKDTRRFADRMRELGVEV